MHLWDHRQKLHPEQLQEFSPRPKDMVLSLLAEQNIDIIDEVYALKKDIKNNLMEFASMMQGCFEAVGQDIKYASNINHQAILDLSAKIDEKAKVFEKSQQTDVPHSNTRACSDNVEDETEGPSKKPTKDLRNCKDDGRDGFKEKQKKIKVRQNKRHKVTWVGTSISKALDRKKFEKDLNVELTVVKAYCIEEEGRFQKTNFRAIVPDVVAKGGIDTLVLQTGSIEITNIDTNKAAMDPKKDIKDYQREWYAKVEDDSTNLFSIAEEAIARDDDLNVVIVKRLPRFDRSSKDIMAIKTKLSSFSNHVYDQLWLKRGSPARIHIVELPLGCDNSSYLKDIIYGSHSNPKYDGLHLIGRAAARHFTYRAVQSILPIISENLRTSYPKTKYTKHGVENYDQDNYHANCPQTQYQRQSVSVGHGGQRQKTYSDAVQNKDTKYSVPTENYWSPLNY